MRRQDRQISESEAFEILQKAEYGILSMCSTSNKGYGIPMNFVLKNNTIFFHCAIEGKKLNYLQSNNQVSFCVVGKTNVIPSKFGTLYESVIISGECTEVYEIEKREALMLFLEKYSSDFIPAGIEYIDTAIEKVKVLKLSISSLTGKARRQ